MGSEETVFWLIHLFVGVVLPFLVLTGCCREDETAESSLDVQS
jgi:hypothetical protein